MKYNKIRTQKKRERERERERKKKKKKVETNEDDNCICANASFSSLRCFTEAAHQFRSGFGSCVYIVSACSIMRLLKEKGE